MDIYFKAILCYNIFKTMEVCRMDIEEIINNPHDALFKRTMVDKVAALDFMQNYLPEEIIEKMDLPDI